MGSGLHSSQCTFPCVGRARARNHTRRTQRRRRRRTVVLAPSGPSSRVQYHAQSPRLVGKVRHTTHRLVCSHKHAHSVGSHSLTHLTAIATATVKATATGYSGPIAARCRRLSPNGFYLLDRNPFRQSLILEKNLKTGFSTTRRARMSANCSKVRCRILSRDSIFGTSLNCSITRGTETLRNCSLVRFFSRSWLELSGTLTTPSVHKSSQKIVPERQP